MTFMSVTTLLMLTLAAVPDSFAAESLWLTDMDDAYFPAYVCICFKPPQIKPVLTTVLKTT